MQHIMLTRTTDNPVYAFIYIENFPCRSIFTITCNQEFFDFFFLFFSMFNPNGIPLNAVKKTSQSFHITMLNMSLFTHLFKTVGHIILH